jgi:hypothetical protein
MLHFAARQQVGRFWGKADLGPRSHGRKEARPVFEPPQCHNTDGTSVSCGFATATLYRMLRFEMGRKPAWNGHCGVVADRKAVMAHAVRFFSFGADSTTTSLCGKLECIPMRVARQIP